MALFGKKSEKNTRSDIYVLLDSNSRMHARGVRREGSDGKTLFIFLSEGDPAALAKIGVLQAVPQDKSLLPQMVRFIGSREKMIALEPMRDLGSAMRRNFRVPVVFDSFIYPTGGGRATLRSIDLSCGGIAFRSHCMLSVGDLFEVVVPITSEGPLLLNAQLLRVHLEPDAFNFYACKFVDMIDDEESMLREAVFAVQVSTARAKSR